MIRKIIRIDKEKCNGCGLCAEACHEGAIGMINQKATLLREDYCDGLGDCLPVCPTDAISIEVRKAAPFDKAAAKANAARRSGCPGERQRAIPREEAAAAVQGGALPSQLAQWPVQIKLAPVSAPFFSGADLLIAADCAAYAYASFHEKFMRGKVTLIGCPKLDMGDYADKLEAIFAENDIQSVTVARMEVPCCSGLSSAVSRALAQSGKAIAARVITISVNGDILDE